MSDLQNPDERTAAAFNRKAFVGLSAGAGFAVTSIASAMAHDTNFGAPHPPIVAENDPAITALALKLARPDTTIDAYAAYPKNLTATTPGVVVVQAIWGVDAQLRDVVRRYAKEGFVAIAPALFTRSNPPSGDGTSDIDLFRAPARALKDEIVAGDLLAGHDWIHTQAARAKIGVTGFCMGGGITLKQVIGRTDYQAASMFYGSMLPGAKRGDPVTPVSYAYTDRITVPLMGSFGARDTSPDIQPDQVRTMFARLSAPHDFKIYDEAGHAFFDDTRKAYVASAAADAWTRTMRWFRTYLT